MKEILVKLGSLITADNIALLSVIITVLIFVATRRVEIKNKKLDDKKTQYLKLIELLKRHLTDVKKDKKGNVVLTEEMKGLFFDTGAALLLYGSKKIYRQYLLFREFIDLGLYPCISAYGISIYRQNLSAYSVHECVSRLRNQIEQEKPQVIQDCYGCNYYDVCDRCVLSCFSSAGNICHTCADISHGIAQYI